jgi:hypothetical protein
MSEHDRKKAEEALVERIATAITDGSMEAECPFNVAKSILKIVNEDEVAPAPSLSDAALIVADHIDNNMNDINELVASIAVTEETPVRHWFSRIVRGIAERNGG